MEITVSKDFKNQSITFNPHPLLAEVISHLRNVDWVGEMYIRHAPTGLGTAMYVKDRGAGEELGRVFLSNRKKWKVHVTNKDIEAQKTRAKTDGIVSSDPRRAAREMLKHFKVKPLEKVCEEAYAAACAFLEARSYRAAGALKQLMVTNSTAYTRTLLGLPNGAVPDREKLTELYNTSSEWASIKSHSDPVVVMTRGQLTLVMKLNKSGNPPTKIEFNDEIEDMPLLNEAMGMLKLVPHETPVRQAGFRIQHMNYDVFYITRKP